MISRRLEVNREHIMMDALVAPLMERASLYVAPSAFVLGWHGYPVFELHYLYRGILTWEMEDGARLRIRGGDVTVIQPNVRHHSFHNAEMPSITLGFAIVPDAPAPAPPFVTKKEQTEAFRLLRRSGNRVFRGSRGLDTAFRALRSKASALLAADAAEPLKLQNLALLRNLLHQCFLLMVYSLGNPTPPTGYMPVKRATRFMEKHVTDDLSADDIARAAGVSKRRLYQLFHDELGEDLVAYHLRLRLEQSMEKLADGNASVSSIAGRLGFSSGAAFSRSFRKNFGLTPTDWRRYVQEEEVRKTHEAHI